MSRAHAVLVEDDLRIPKSSQAPPPPDPEAGTWRGRSVACRFMSSDGREPALLDPQEPRLPRGSRQTRGRMLVFAVELLEIVRE